MRSYYLIMLVFLLFVSHYSPAAEPLVLFDFTGPAIDAGRQALSDARAESVATPEGRRLQVITGTEKPWPGITLRPPGEAWELADYDSLVVSVKNTGENPMRLHCRIDNPSPPGKLVSMTESIELKPGQAENWRIYIVRRLPESMRDRFFGMRGYPGGMLLDRGLDASQISQLVIFVVRSGEQHQFQIERIAAEQTLGITALPIPVDDENFFPMIDRYGQFMHKTWPGKVTSDDDLRRNREMEATELKAQPGPASWDQYGGWKDGPQQEAKGFFYPKKIDGRWWLVDPEGFLFWSHGVDCVHGHNAVTPITDREHWFAELPERQGAFASLYGRGNWAPHGYYQGKSYETFDLGGWNLMRKYGDNWPETYADLVHRRLRSWAMNTIGNWSGADIYLQRRTPYTATVNASSKPLEGSDGYWGKFPDVFDPSFRENLDKAMQREIDRTADDPWCLGYFVGNELSWGPEFSLAQAALASPADQAAKQRFIEDLQKKYETIDRLNAAWKTDHASWQALVESRTPPDVEAARDDLAAFADRTAREYFRQCREAVKQVAPERLYLGCRFAWVNDRAARAASEFCDVVSYNRYRYTLADLKLPEGSVDKPIIIGEFHFGALDRGMFHTGLCPVKNQQARAETYEAYLRSALENPAVVGTHWFQFGDQATTGRGDGENYQIGLVDVCDTPYPETIEAVRRVGEAMYRIRRDATLPATP